MGSCFAEHIGQRLRARKFNVTLNPFGILFNPLSVERALLSCLRMEQDFPVFEHQGLFHSWWHHGRFSAPSKDQILQNIKVEWDAMRKSLDNLDVLIVTFGSAHVYRYKENDMLVANCHKVPTTQFYKELLSVDKIVSAWKQVLKDLFQMRPGLQVVLSISPVRYWKDGPIDNQWSKASLILAAAELTDDFDNCHYFPAYELLLDDLRDYRFYDRDMLHPGDNAVDYIWNRFIEGLFSPSTRDFAREMEALNRSLQHRPIHPESEAHQTFLMNLLLKIDELQLKYQEVDLESERNKVSLALEQ